MILHGIKNCDIVKKTRTWLAANGIAHDFHDYKASGADPAKLRAWVDALGWEVLLNRAGTTFRALPDADKTNIDAEKAIALMLAQPSMIKRPVVEGPGVLLIGFKPETYTAAFLNS